MASADVIRISECKAAVVARLRNLDAAEWGMLWENAAAADEEEEEEPLEQVPHSAPFSLSSPITGTAGAISARRSWAWREKMRSLGRQLMPRRGSCDDLNVAIATASVTPAKRAKSFPESKERGNEKGARRGRSRADSRGVWRSVYEPRWLEEGLAETSGDDERRPHGANRNEMGVRNDTAQRAGESGLAGREGSARYQLLRHNSLPCACASQRVSPTLPRRASVMHGDSSAERSACSVAAAKDRPSSSSSSQHRRSPSLLVIPPFLPSCLPSPSPSAAPWRTAPSMPPTPIPVLRGDSAAPSECSPTAETPVSARLPIPMTAAARGGTPEQSERIGARREEARGRPTASSLDYGDAATHGEAAVSVRPGGQEWIVLQVPRGARVRADGLRQPPRAAPLPLRALGRVARRHPCDCWRRCRRRRSRNGGSCAREGQGSAARARGIVAFGGEWGDCGKRNAHGRRAGGRDSGKGSDHGDAADAVASSEAAFKGDEALGGSTGAAEELEEGAERGTDGGEAEGKGEGGQGGEGGEGEEGGGGGGEVPMPLRVYMLPLTGELNFHVLL
ncbi:unnamed protein product, partial [Closterium sp. NIES-64]